MGKTENPRLASPASRSSALRFIAYHEAGHVVVGAVLGLRVQSTDILPDDEGGRGHTRFVYPGDWFHPGSGPLTRKERNFAETVLTVFLAGFAAESRLGPADPDSSGYDFDSVIGQWVAYVEPEPDKQEATVAFFLERASSRLQRPEVWRAVDAVAAALLERIQLDGAQALELVEIAIGEHGLTAGGEAMGVDVDGYGFGADERTVRRLIADVRVMSPSSIERAAEACDRYVGDKYSAHFQATEKAALHALEQAGRGAVWDEVRRSLFGLTESGSALVSWRAEHGDTGHKAERVAFAAALGLTAGDLIDRVQMVTLLRPMAETLPWLLPGESAPPSGSRDDESS